MKASHSNAIAPIRLIQITDTHLFAGPDEELKGCNTRRALERVVSRAQAEEPRASAILATGDLAQDESAGAYRQFREILEPTGLTVWCLPGNHDNPALMAQLLNPGIPAPARRVEAGTWQVFLLNSQVPGEIGGRVTPDLVDWLDRALGEAAKRPALIAMHHPPAALGSPWLDAIGLDGGEALLDMLAGHARVAAVVAGHVHQCFDQRVRGVRVLTTPATCIQFLPGSETFTLDTQPPGYRILDLHANGRLETEVRRVPGALAPASEEA
ncbi:MAG: 3',5'-cyclic-AMP phosphodiesterase [Gammaproteobacteria bacterium]|jgi:Icc protein